jgi:hypothetical protein
MCLSHPGCPLGWEAGDNLKMLPLPTASCTLTEEGDQYNVHFTRGQHGVVSLRIEGGGLNNELVRQPAVASAAGQIEVPPPPTMPPLLPEVLPARPAVHRLPTGRTTPRGWLLKQLVI